MRTRNAKFWFTLAAGLLALTSAGAVSAAGTESSSTQVHYRTTEVEGVSIFYREAGPKDAPTLLLLHGFPTSSHMFRDLIPALADRYHVVAPDFPGFGYSDAPPADQFEYSFDHLARLIEQFTEQLQLTSYSLYVMDYGAPVGFRLAAAHPERVDTIVVQNGNAYAEGIDNPFWDSIKAYWRDQTEENRNALRDLLTLDATKWQYTDGVRDLSKISPDTWAHVQPLLDRPGNQEIQLDLFYSYGSNPPLYPEWQAYFRKHQPPMLIVWGKHDQIFPSAGAHPYLRDLPNAELHLLDTGHFALEEEGDQIARLMRAFLKRNVKE
ncbi:alpha/beta fold hydrolase [Rubinisphaera brasiliensis]|uniref:Alpha/beta hydrolase fold protein n=1 Tax=Rubinisphaera brasiliensis (strain ATCC 49424 / DSM 5305 / JCM 21570 / IAM 15109 / NBRC 103401 / IFAM 1448) TaxID=756272 RepID=F0SQT7_RUBBR|nr:alpha/beta hydrolase [Rubinisphaera brasiliensis]ADY59117.1 alpha/beta hydrolase fold protein [Rubinisphaera brasiliensis DSM 5305]